MNELLTWLRDRIADDERTAQEGFSGQADPVHGWGTDDVTMANPPGMRPAVAVKYVITPHVGIIHEPAQRAHVVRWHPGRVLAHCAATRGMVDHLVGQKHAVVEGDDWFTCAVATEDRDGGTTSRWEPGADCDCGRDTRVYAGLRILAAPFAHCEGYRDEWRP